MNSASAQMDKTPAGRGRNTERRAEEAYLRLLREGKTPSVESIRALIGGGGTDLLNRVIRRLRTRQAELLSLPALPDALVGQFLELWERAVAASEARFAEEKAAFADQLEGERKERGHQKLLFEQKLQEAEARIAALRTQIEDFSRRESILLCEKAALSDRVQEARDALSVTQGALAHAERQTAVMASAAERRAVQLSDLRRLVEELIGALPVDQQAPRREALLAIVTGPSDKQQDEPGQA